MSSIDGLNEEIFGVPKEGDIVMYKNVDFVIKTVKNKSNGMVFNLEAVSYIDPDTGYRKIEKDIHISKIDFHE